MTKSTLTLLLATVLVLGACGKKSAEKTIEQAIEKNGGGKAHVDLSKNQMTIQTKDGEKIEIASGAEGLAVPADFPKDIYVYPKVKVEGSIKTGEATQLTLVTADAPAKVAEEYKGQMKKSGWKEKTAVQMNEMTMLEYSKDQRDLLVHITSDGKQTRIMLMESIEKQAGK